MRFLGKLKQRKEGVGSIIGAVFIVLILLSGLGFYTAYLSITDHYNENTGTMNDLNLSQNQEKIIIKQIGVTPTNNLTLTVENQGTVHSHIIWLGIFNKSVSPENQTFLPLDVSLNPSEELNITSSFTVVVGQKYVVQLVTELGNTVQTVFYPASAVQCALSLTAASPTAYLGNNITMILTVTNNDSEVDVIQNITVSIGASPSNCVQIVDSSPLTVTALARGESAFFWRVYNTQNTGTVTFNATYTSALPGVFALANVTILAPPQQGGSSVSITGLNGTADYNPTQWATLNGTQFVSGSIADLATISSNYTVFRSYYSGSTLDISHPVDNNSSNVDGASNIGTQSNFPAIQNGPDSVYDTLTEAPNGLATTPYYPVGYNL